METNSTYHIDLITRYFFGEATPEDIGELEEWLKADPANHEIFSGYQKTWNAVENSRMDDSPDIDNEWNKLYSRISPPETRTIPVAKSNFDVRPSIFNIQYSTSTRWSLRIAAIFILVAIPAFLLYRYVSSPSEMQLSAGNEVSEQTLPDGTVVTLNAGSTLTYPSRFKGSSRKVTLLGEAWFEVSHDRSKPFIIAAGNARIEVTGTSFFVNTKTFSNTREVILATGKVKVYYEEKPTEMALLLPGDKAEMSSACCEIRTGMNEDQNYLAWKTKHLVFTNTPLNEVVALLTGVYHTSVRISGNRLSGCRITTTFDKQSLESVLNVLQATLDLQIRNTGAGIELSGHGCN